MQKRSIATPTTSQDISPPKRAKLDGTQSTGNENGITPIPSFDTELNSTQGPSSTPLRSIPFPVLLLAQAQIHHSMISLIQPALSLPPTITTANSYAELYVHLVRTLGSAVAALRCIINNGNNGSEGMGNGRIELRARCELAEILIRELNVVQDPSSNLSLEVEGIISKGIAAARTHQSFSEFQYRLSSLWAELSIIQENSKFAKTILKRSISTLTSSNTLLHPEWLYSSYLSLASIAINEADYPTALFNYREMEKLSQKRNDLELYWTVKVMIAKLVLGEKEWELVGGILDEIAEMMGIVTAERKESTVAHSTQPTASPLAGVDQGFVGRQHRVQFLVTYCLYQAQIGNVKLAKEKLKIAHSFLDEKGLEDGDAEGWVRVYIGPADTPQTFSSPAPIRTTHSTSSPTQILSSPIHSGLFVQIAVPPRHLIYGYAFLVSVAVHRDPFGGKPRSKLFANEGLRIVENMVIGREPRLTATTPPSHLTAALKTIFKMKIGLLLFSAELDILRSSFKEGLESLFEAIGIARADEGLWETFKLRITLGMGSLYQAQGKEELALECFETVVRIGLEKGDEDMITLARVSILMIKICQGTRIRLAEDEGATSMSMSMSRSNSKNSKSSRRNSSMHSIELSTLTRQILSFTNNSSLPSFKILGEFVEALTGGEIIKAKQHLSNALNLANGSMANHCKALMLALLANLFLWTRNDQAQKMLTASFTILRGMGSKNESSVAAGEEFDKDNIVGNARLGLWVGERLLECYQRDNNLAKVKRQETYNAVHRRVLERES